MPSTAQRRTTRVLLAAALVAIPRVASAHSQIQGMSEFWSGVVHPFYTPAHVLLLVGLGLYMGQQVPRQIAVSVAAFSVASAFALAATTMATATAVAQPVLLTAAMCTAIAIVVERPLPTIACALLYAVSAILLGLDSSVEQAAPGPRAEMLLGTWLCMCFVVFELALVTFPLKRTWQRVGIRVAGSWILAISMLVIAFALKR